MNNPDPSQKVMTVTVPLESALERDAGALAELRFRRPMGGDFRGLSLAKLGQLDYDEIR